MRVLAVAAAVLCLVSTGFGAEILTGTTLTVDSFGSMVDPAGLEELDATDAVAGMSKAEFNALPGLKVVQFAAASQGQKVTSIVAVYDGVNSVTFSNFGDPTGYNYGGGTSAGRSAHSGAAAMEQLGVVQGVQAAGPFHDDGAGNPALNWFKADIAVSAPGMGVSAIGFAVDGRDDQATLGGGIWLTFHDGSEVEVEYTRFGGVAGSGLFFGYQAPAGKFITRIEATRDTNSGNSFLALDDLAFVVTPEPASLSLLALGGLAILRRRRA